MADRLPESILRRLREARSCAMMERSSFGPDGEITIQFQHGDPVTYPSITAFVKATVKNHHHSWIIQPIEAILNWSASTDDGSQSEYDLVARLRGPLPNPALLEDAANEIEQLRRVNNILVSHHLQVSAAIKNVDHLITQAKEVV